MTHCHSCGDEYQKIGRHWYGSDCPYPKPTERQSEIITGMLMGDASISGGTQGNPFLQAEMVNEEFLLWLHEELGHLSANVKMVNTASEQASRNNSDGEYQDVYKIVTRRNPNLEKWQDWYSSGEKVFPDITLTPTIAGVWYCCDGWKNEQSNGRPYVAIGAANEIERSDRLIEMFEQQGFEASWVRRSIRLTVDDSETFWSWAEKPPGFKYKWQ